VPATEQILSGFVAPALAKVNRQCPLIKFPPVNQSRYWSIMEEQEHTAVTLHFAFSKDYTNANK